MWSPLLGVDPPHVRHAKTVAHLRESGADLPVRLSLFGHTRLSSTDVDLLDAHAQLTAAEFQRRASEHVEEALATLRAAQEWAPEWGVRVMAAEKLIDRAFGRANQPLSVSTDDMTPAERDARIEFLLAKRRERDGLAVAGITGTTDALLGAPTIDAEGRPVGLAPREEEGTRVEPATTKPNGQAT